MFDLLDLNPTALGIDISDSSIKLVKLKRKGKFLSLASFGQVLLKLGVVEEGEIKNPEELIKSLKELSEKIKGEKLNTNRVIISLPEKKGFFAITQVPKMKENELKLAVPFEAENHIPLPINDVYLDFQVIDPGKANTEHIDILLSAFPKKIIRDYIFCIKKAGFQIQALEMEPQSICRSLIKKEVSPAPVMIVNFGSIATNLIVFSGYSLRFTTSIPFSILSLDQAISKSLNISLKEAENLRQEYGLESSEDKEKKIDGRGSAKKIDKKEITAIIISIIRDLVPQIGKYIEYYQTHSFLERLSAGSKGIAKIILSGYGANSKGLANFLSLSLRIPVEAGNPWINILPEPLREVPELSFNESLSYTTALGLALRGIKEDNFQ